MPADTTESMAEQRKVATINHLACPSYSLYVQLLWYPVYTYYPGGMKARVSPVQWSKPQYIDPTQDSNSGGFKIISGDHYTTTASMKCYDYTTDILNFTPRNIHAAPFCFPWYLLPHLVTHDTLCMLPHLDHYLTIHVVHLVTQRYTNMLLNPLRTKFFLQFQPKSSVLYKGRWDYTG